MTRSFEMIGVLLSILALQTWSLATAETTATDGDENDLDVLGSSTTADLVELICSCREDEFEAAHRHRDCYEIMKAGATESGIYTIYPSINGAKDTAVVVWCDLETYGGGWTVLQKRQDGSVDFNLEWNDYKDGFGHPGGEYWLGNENIYVITNQKEYEFQVEVEEFDGTLHLEKYTHFRLSDEASNYKLLTKTYTGKQDVCTTPLGMESGSIPNREISASSNHAGAIYQAPNARLKNAAGSWIAATHDANQWIQVDLVMTHIVTGVVLQGRHDSAQWVKKYNVRYIDALVWRYIMDDATGNYQEFAGSTNQNSAKTTFFDYPIKARYVRIQPTDWQGAVSLRMELLGCEGTFLAFENNRPFSTKDIDNDVEGTKHCAAERSAWWYGQSCTGSDLNYEFQTGAGPTNRGIVWRDFSAKAFSVVRSEMKIRPV